MSYLAEWLATIARAIIGGIIPGMTPGMPIKERARATVEAGYRAFRFGGVGLQRISDWVCRLSGSSRTSRS